MQHFILTHKHIIDHHSPLGVWYYVPWTITASCVLLIVGGIFFLVNSTKSANSIDDVLDLIGAVVLTTATSKQQHPQIPQAPTTTHWHITEQHGWSPSSLLY